MAKLDETKRLRKSIITSLKDLNIEEARGWTINRLMQIEYEINRIIINQIKPANKEAFEDIILHSSIMDWGSKLKVISNFKTVDKKVIDKIRTLVSIRNGFAHAPISETISAFVTPATADLPESISGTVETTLQVMNSQGEIKSKVAYDYLVEFKRLFDEVRAELRKIRT